MGKVNYAAIDIGSNAVRLFIKRWKFRRCRTDMCQFNQQIIRVYDRIFTSSFKKPPRFHCNVLVKWLIFKNQVIHTGLSVSPCTATLLPE